MKLHLDFETRSAVDLKKVGAWAYALHPSTEILCMGWGTRPDNVRVSTAAEVMTTKAALDMMAMFAVGFVEAHNAQFEYAIYNLILHRRFNWPARWDPKLWSCTLARAAQVGLPLDLESLGRVLEIKTPKDLEGRRVMHQLCKPLLVDPLGDPVYDNDPEKFKRLYAYNRVDVLAEMEVDALLPQLVPHERAIWERDLAMNRRGIQVDLDFARKASTMSGQLVDDLNVRLRTLTGGAVSKASRIAEIKQYLVAHGVAVPTKEDADGEDKETLDKAAVLDLLGRDDLPPKVREVIEVRQQVGKSTSTAKYAKALEMVCPDGRVRGASQYHAAHTGRDGGRLLQLQNFPKGFKAKEQAEAVAMILAGDVVQFSGRYGVKAMSALSDALRALVVAAKGKVLVRADYNSIELCVEMWLAGDKAVLAQLFRGEKPYVEMAQLIYDNPKIFKPTDEDGTYAAEYDLGKRTVLGGGYGMGAPKFKLTCKVQANLDISDELAERAIKMYRTKYALVVQMWKDVEAAVIAAVKNPTQCFASCGGKVLWGMSKDRRFLVARLPSGRFLWYWKPSVRVGKTPWGEMKEEMVYWGEHPRTKEWCPIKTYGGSLVENVTQAVARDVMFAGWANVEEAGYPVLFKVHDELVAEVPAVNENDCNRYTLEGFTARMCALPDWAKGCPVAAEGWVGPRYRK